MKDEAFHLSPLDIRRFDFGTALRGYDKARVDEFRDQVAAEVEYLLKQCQELENKAKGFHEQLRAFRERDKALNEALISAQQLRGEIREQADRESQLIIREAKAEGEKMVEQARSEVRTVQAELDSLVQDASRVPRAASCRRAAPAGGDRCRRKVIPAPRPETAARRACSAEEHAAPQGSARQCGAEEPGSAEQSASGDRPDVETPDPAPWISDLVKKD